MAVNLSTTTSIVDYLGSQGKDSSYTARSKMYKDLGLETRLGSYTGSSSQNTNLLNSLKQQTPATKPVDYSNPANFMSLLPQYQTKNTPLPPIPEGGLNATPNPGWNPDTVYPSTPTAPATSALNVAKTPTAASAVSSVSTPTTPTAPPQQSAAEVLQSLGIDPASLGAPKAPTPEEITAAVEADPAYKLYQESLGLKTIGQQASAETEKTALDQKAAATKQETENALASKGLAFSGIRSEAVQDIAASLATSKLGVDRKLALGLLESDVDSRGKFLDIASNLIKSAIDDQGDTKKSALDQLNKAGYALIGDKLMPTAEALRLTQTADTAEFNQAVALESLKIRWQNAQTSSERNSILQQLREIELAKKTSVAPGQYIQTATGLPWTGTKDEKDTLNRSETIKDFYIPNLLTMLEGIETGAVTGKVNKYTAKMPVTQYMRNEDLSMFNAMASYFSQQIVYMNSGKQINEAEMRILSNSLPSAELTTAENKKRLGQFLEITNRSYNNYMTRNGISIAGGTSVNGVGNVGSVSDIILEGSIDGIEWSVTED